VPEAHAQRAPKTAIRPHAQEQGDAIRRPALLAGEAPRAPRHGRRQGLRARRIVEDAKAACPDAARPTSAVQECGPGPITWQQPRQAVMRGGPQGFGQRHPAARCAITAQRGEIAPHQCWQRAPSCVRVGSALYAISPLLRNPRPMRKSCQNAWSLAHHSTWRDDCALYSKRWACLGSSSNPTLGVACPRHSWRAPCASSPRRWHPISANELEEGGWSACAVNSDGKCGRAK
jgi:hypothetical protein